MLVDTHCHLNDPAFKDALPEVLARAKAVGVFCFIVPSYDTDSLDRTVELASSFPGVIFPALGIHPWHVEPHKQTGGPSYNDFVGRHLPCNAGKQTSVKCSVR